MTADFSSYQILFPPK